MERNSCSVAKPAGPDPKHSPVCGVQLQLGMQRERCLHCFYPWVTASGLRNTQSTNCIICIENLAFTKDSTDFKSLYRRYLCLTTEIQAGCSAQEPEKHLQFTWLCPGLLPHCGYLWTRTGLGDANMETRRLKVSVLTAFSFNERLLKQTIFNHKCHSCTLAQLFKYALMSPSSTAILEPVCVHRAASCGKRCHEIPMRGMHKASQHASATQILHDSISSLGQLFLLAIFF